MFIVEGAYCVFPRAPYSPAALPAEYHSAVRESFERAARRDILPGARSREERRGLEERCEEIASAMYLHWLEKLRGKESIAAGDHGHAIRAVIKYFRLTGWHGMTGFRRAQNRKKTAEMIRWQNRRREGLQDRPDSVAMAKERIGHSPALAKKAYRLASRSGIPGGVPALLQLAALAETVQRGRYVPAALPFAGVPAAPGDTVTGCGCECRPARDFHTGRIMSWRMLTEANIRD
jgi:hypothetical protein